MGITEASAQAAVDRYVSQFRATEIQYIPYTSGIVDRYKQRDKTFGTPVTVVGRAIHNPTEESITAIGQGEVYDIAFLFSRLEMLRKFPGVADGEWIQAEGRMAWRNRTYKIQKVQPSGQVGETFSLVVVLATSILGERDS
jgi:hypothetical protein